MTATAQMFPRLAGGLGIFLGRDGMSRALSNAPAGFMEGVEAFVRALPPGTVCTGEAIRLGCTQLGIVPHHHNCWGAATLQLVRRGLINETGRWARSLDPRSHGRRTVEYIRRPHPET